MKGRCPAEVMSLLSMLKTIVKRSQSVTLSQRDPCTLQCQTAQMTMLKGGRKMATEEKFYIGMVDIYTTAG